MSELIIQKSREFECGTCQKTFDTAQHLQVHVNSRHEGKRLKCNLCEKGLFTQTPRLKKHFEIAHGAQGIFKCKMCDKTFIKKTALSKHMDWSHKDSEFIDEYQNSPNIFYHEMIIQGLFKCEFCFITFVSEKKMQLHKKMNHKLEIKNNNARVKGEKQNIQHIRIRRPQHLTKSNDFKCNTCQKVFKGQSNLQLHVKTSHEGKKLKCNLCDTATFTQTPSLKSHFKVAHGSQGIFKCNVCNKTFIKIC